MDRTSGNSRKKAASRSPDAASRLRDADVDRRLKEAQRMESVGVLASGLAHDFNNALTVMLGQAHILQAMSDEVDGRRLESIISSGRRAAALAWQLLDLAHKHQNQREPLLLAPLLKESVKLLSASFAPRIAFGISVQDAQSTAEISHTEFHQVVFNLCINSAQSMESGTVDVELQQLRDEGRNWNLLVVRDHGHGIAPEQLATVFDPFFTTKRDGTGLGLTMVKKIAEECGGRVELESALGQGTTARVWLPAVASRLEVLGAPEGKWRGSGERVAVLDDDAAVREMMAAMLEVNGYAPALFVSPDDLETHLSSADALPDLLLLDVVMPQQSGAALCASLSVRYPGLPIILMSACRKSPSVDAAIHFGQARTFLNKPFDARELLACLNAALYPP